MARGRPKGSRNKSASKSSKYPSRSYGNRAGNKSKALWAKNFNMQKRLNYRGCVYWKEKVETTMIMNPQDSPPILTDNTWMNPGDRTGYSYHTYSFDRLTNSDSLRNMFKKFRLIGVQSAFYPSHSNGPSQQIIHKVQGTSVPSGPQGQVSQTLDRWTYKPDMTNKSNQMYYKFTNATGQGDNQEAMTTWPDLKTAAEADAKVVPFRGNRPVKVYIKPKVSTLQTIANDPTAFVMTQAPKNAWFPTNKPDNAGGSLANDVQFRGLRCAWSQLAPTNWDENRDAPPTIKRIDTYYFVFKSQF